MTWRVRLDEPAELKDLIRKGKPIIFAHWHRDELAIVQLVTHYRIATMTSTSKDGQLIDFVIRKLGGATSKGSSTRGGASALKGMVRLLRDRYRGSMAVDGPKGPIFQVKAGVFELSRLADAWIVPVGVASHPHYVFEKSWNKARLPKLFAKVIVTFGLPSKVGDQDVRDPALAESLATHIANICTVAESKLS